MTRIWERVLYVPAKGDAEFRCIGNDLMTLAHLIEEGHLQAVKLTDHLILFCDAAFPAPSDLYNFSIRGHFIHGDAFFVRRDGTRLASIQDEDVAVILAQSA